MKATHNKIQVETARLQTPDGCSIALTCARRAGRDKVIVLAPGFFNSHRSALLQQLTEVLFEDDDVCGMDFRGHGGSSGWFTFTAREEQDLLTVLRWLKDRYSWIGVVGFSLGAATTLLSASGEGKPLINSVVAVSPPADFSRIDFHFWSLDVENDILYNLGEGRRGKGVRPGPFWLPKKRPMDCVADIEAPVRIIHGTADWLIRPWHSQVLYERLRTRKSCEWIPQGPHAEYLMRPAYRDAFVSLIRSWFQETGG